MMNKFNEFTFKFQYDNTLRFNILYYSIILLKFKFQYDNTLRRGYKSHSDIILFLLSFVNLNLLLKNKKFKYFQILKYKRNSFNINAFIIFVEVLRILHYLRQTIKFYKKLSVLSSCNPNISFSIHLSFLDLKIIKESKSFLIYFETSYFNL